MYMVFFHIFRGSLSQSKQNRKNVMGLIKRDCAQTWQISDSSLLLFFGIRVTMSVAYDTINLLIDFLESMANMMYVIK